MTFAVTTRESATSNSMNVDSNRSFEGESQASVQTTIADGATDQEILLAIDISATKLVVFKSTQAVTVKTNSSGAPDDTLALTANIPMIWREGDYNAIFLSVDVSSIFVTNASGSDATLQVLAIIDLP